MTPTNADLRQFILNFFSDEELETLCFDYFREARQNFTGGMTRNSKVMLLIDFCISRNRIDDLTAALERERPTTWLEKFGAPPAQKPSFSEETRFLERDPRQVFISHATADAAFAHRLAGDLRAEGWRVWIASDSIRPGEKWVEAIDRGLETSGVFVVALTPAAVASRWVKMETNAAIGLSQQDEIRFISLSVEECRLTALWRQFQYIPFRRNYEVGLGELLRWLDGGESQAVKDVGGPARNDGVPRYGLYVDERRRRVYYEGQEVFRGGIRTSRFFWALYDRRNTAVSYLDLLVAINEGYNVVALKKDPIFRRREIESLSKLAARVIIMVDPQRVYIKNVHGMGYKFQTDA